MSASGIPSSINAPDHVRELASASRARLLSKAATFASLHAPHTLWQRRMGTGAAMVLVRLEWPGVLCVYDPKTGSKLAESLTVTDLNQLHEVASQTPNP